LLDIAEAGGYVVSTGGGIVIADENIEVMKKNGVIVTLIASPEVIYERVKMIRKDLFCRYLILLIR